MSDALVATPARSASYTATFAAREEPRSSQLTMSNLSSGAKPRRSASVVILASDPRSEPLDDRAGPEPAAAAHRDESERAVDALELVQRRGDEARAGGTDRVAECDGRPVGVHVAEVWVHVAFPREHDRGERLVDLDCVEVFDREPGPTKQVLRGVDRAGEHEHRIDAHEALVDDASARPQAELLHPSRAREQHRGRAVGDLRRGTGGVHAVLARDGLERRELLE